MILILLVLLVVIIVLSNKIDKMKQKQYILPGYEDKNIKTKEHFQSSFELSTYHYGATFSEKYENNKYYQKVGDEVANLQEIIENSSNMWDTFANFDISVISRDDYFYLIDKSKENEYGFKHYDISLYIYDCDSNVLYYFLISE